MTSIAQERLAVLLAPYLPGHALAASVLTALQAYLDLLLRWNARTNLTAIRDPEEIVTRHFGESLFAGVCVTRLAGVSGQAMDLGSGAGFPGIPMALLLPGWHFVLAESQGKKAAFLREAVRTLGLDTEVWPVRAEAMPPERHFDLVAMRAVDHMATMVDLGRSRVRSGGWLLQLSGELSPEAQSFPMPGSHGNKVGLTRL